MRIIACYETNHSCDVVTSTRAACLSGLSSLRFASFLTSGQITIYVDHVDRILSVTRVFAENLFGLGFLQSVSYIKPIPAHEKIFAVGKKVAQMPLLNLFFLGLVGLGLGGVRRFHSNI